MFFFNVSFSMAFGYVSLTNKMLIKKERANSPDEVHLLVS